MFIWAEPLISIVMFFKSFFKNIYLVVSQRPMNKGNIFQLRG